MRLVILGGPGSGKSTQARWVCHQLGISEISTGNILRKAIAAQTDLGRKAQPYVEKGELVPDEILIEFMRQRLVQPDTAKRWLLEGYPRTAFQAEELDFLLEDFNQQLDWAIYLEVPESVMMSRSVKRSTPPDGSSKGGSSRLDDHPEIVERRIHLFYERTVPILEYYGYRQKLLTINGNQPREQVQQDILAALGS
ncbi:MULTISPECIES: adenylate kinase family protein [unclassified Coleofasciculus]|uniref:adenylate kinase family protein n=1 Tax=unclassified Coleofasciculus TaxID=2692782 RepID=UPI001880A143|nr:MULTISPECIES: nucleoside monophosphate kinase [unclassified Coleofasciculus]MBE9126177.1 nucleoside monophosphate kinase [Coleofasciculus sp. LEGE 07081]MBE9149616.1 nucleoside monophosphate kinase [Coleofasciculus sp. LEGE 07092]